MGATRRARLEVEGRDGQTVWPLEDKPMTDIAADRSALKRDSQVIGLVGMAHFSSHFFQLSLAPLFPLLREAFGVNYVTLGSLVTTFYLVSGICQAFAGILVDRWGARPMLLAGVAGMATCIGLAGLIGEFWIFYPLLAVAGMANSVFHPADFSVLSARVSRQRLGRAYSVHALSGTLGYAVAPAVIGGFAALADWRTALVGAGLCGWMVVLLLLRYGRLLDAPARAAKEVAGPAPSYAKLVTSPAIMMAFGYFLLTAAAGTGFQTFSTATLVDYYGITLESATTALSVYLVATAIGIFSGGILADRTSRYVGVAVLGLSICAGGMLLVATGLLSFPAALAAIGIAGFAGGTTAPSRDILVKAATPPGSTGKVFGFVYSGLDAGSTLAPLIFGSLLDRHADRALFAGIALLFALAILSVVSISRRTTQTVAT